MNRAAFIVLRLAAFALVALFVSPQAEATAPRPFVVAPHDNVTIEWWYLNAHVATHSGRHIAVIGSFFRFGNGAGQLARDSKTATPRCHYLIWAITDRDAKTHRTFSLADRNSLNMMAQFMGLKVLMNPNDTRAATLLDGLQKGSFPPPTKLLPGMSKVTGSPFAVTFGADDTLVPVKGKRDVYSLALREPGAGKLWVKLRFAATKPAMYVGGTGNTGLRKPEDMKYISLTRCSVDGLVSEGVEAPEAARGEGWFDHQWGDTWTTQSAGWDWWGVQLDDGTDILFFRQRDLATGKVFFPLATFMDKAGHVTVTKNIDFEPDLSSLWTSPSSGVSYPLNWTVTFPDQHVTLKLTPDALDQEMPILSGSPIWEGSCTVNATSESGVNVPGTAYMELVGYNSPAVKQGLLGNPGGK